MSNLVIEMSDVHKSFKKTKALAGFNLQVPAGSIYGSSRIRDPITHRKYQIGIMTFVRKIGDRLCFTQFPQYSIAESAEGY